MKYHLTAAQGSRLSAIAGIVFSRNGNVTLNPVIINLTKDIQDPFEKEIADVLIGCGQKKCVSVAAIQVAAEMMKSLLAAAKQKKDRAMHVKPRNPAHAKRLGTPESWTNFIKSRRLLVEKLIKGAYL